MKRILIRIDEDLYSIIKKNAKAVGTSVNREIEQTLFMGVQGRKTTAKKIKAARNAALSDDHPESLQEKNNTEKLESITFDEIFKKASENKKRI